MNRIAFFLLLISPILFQSCSSGKKAYEKGDYYSAVIKAVNRLRQKPNHKKSKETLKNSYPFAVQDLEERAANALRTNARFKHREVLQAHESINRLYREIQASPGARRVIPNPVNYFSKMASLKQKAAAESYQIGMSFLNRETRQDAKEAYFLFRDVLGYVPNYEDARDKMDEAKFIATLKIIVEQIPVPTRYSLSANFFQDKVEEYLNTQYRGNEFVRFYTQRQADREKLPFVDQYLRLQFDDFVVGETHTERYIETVTRDSVVVGSVTLESGEKVDAYGTVSAKLTVNRAEVSSRGLFSMRVVDADSRAVVTHQKFPGEFVWFSEWGNFNGDERALSEEQLAICNSQPVPPPPPQQLFIEFTRPIYDQFTRSVQSFYSRY